MTIDDLRREFYEKRARRLEINRKSNAKTAKRRRAERIKIDGRWVHPDAPHGKTSGYTGWHCRCTECSQAMKDYIADWEKRNGKR